MKKIVDIMLFIWQLPQNLVALFYILILHWEEKILVTKNGIKFYYNPNMITGVSLGNYVFLSRYHVNNNNAYDHEYGHCLQSRILGPLYLIVIGIPSAINNIVDRIIIRYGENVVNRNYYSFYTEKWANRLGGIPNYDGVFKGSYGKVSKDYKDTIVNYKCKVIIK